MGLPEDIVTAGDGHTVEARISEHSFVCLDTDRAEECIIGACLDWEDIWNDARLYTA